MGTWTEQLTDLWDHFIAPGLPALLPTKLGSRLQRWLSRRPFLYNAQTAAALSSARTYVSITDETLWCSKHRMTRLADFGDPLLSRLRSDDWMGRHLDIVGSWPTSGTPFIGLAFHYGAGMWGLRHLHSQGMRVAFLAQRYSRADFGKHGLRYYYARLRQRELERISGAPVIFTGGSSPQIKAELATGGAVVGLIDVPPSIAHGHRPVTLLGRTIGLPTGLLQIAAAAGVPIVPFSVGVDFVTGRRRLHIGTALEPAQTDICLDQVAAFLDALLRADSSGWYFWPQFSALIKAGELTTAATAASER